MGGGIRPPGRAKVAQTPGRARVNFGHIFDDLEGPLADGMSDILYSYREFEKSGNMHTP